MARSSRQRKQRWANFAASVRPGPFGASRMLPQARTFHVIAQLPYEVQRRVLGATSTRVMPSACLIILAGRDIQGHASLELDIPRQSVEIQPHIADLFLRMGADRRWS